jgi:hypothetical protein
MGERAGCGMKQLGGRANLFHRVQKILNLIYLNEAAALPLALIFIRNRASTREEVSYEYW